MTQWAKGFVNKYGNLCLHFQGPWKRLSVVMKDSDESPRLDENTKEDSGYFSQPALAVSYRFGKRAFLKINLGINT